MAFFGKDVFVLLCTAIYTLFTGTGRGVWDIADVDDGLAFTPRVLLQPSHMCCFWCVAPLSSVALVTIAEPGGCYLALAMALALDQLRVGRARAVGERSRRQIYSPHMMLY